MKRSARKDRALPPGEISAAFARGFVATALLTAIQSRWDDGTPSGRTVLRTAIQGGAALAAGTAAADALQRRNYADALVAAAGGAAAVAAAEYLMNPPRHDDMEKTLGQEEAQEVQEP